MKTRLCALVFLLQLCFTTCFSQSYFSYYKGKQVSYAVSLKKLIISYKSSTETTAFLSGFSQVKQTENLKDLSLYLVWVENINSSAELSNLIKVFGNSESISYISPVFLTKEGNEIGGLTNEVIVRLNSTTSQSDFRALLDKTHTQITQHYAYDSLTYFISSKESNQSDALTLANSFYESGYFEFAEPNWLLFSKATTNDPYYSQQWALNNLGGNGGTVGADIDAPEAWEITTGCSSIKIAILDDGVDLTHPDLDGNLVSGYDATGGGSSGAHTGTSSHGTLCAGIAAAEGNNSLGVAGVAYGSKLIPVRVLTSSSTVTDVTTSGWMATGIDWAWLDGGADVISMSFEMQVGQAAIDAAINRALLWGRAGKGSIVVASTANDNSSTIAYPASNAQVIAVGGTTNQDTRASYSNYGTGIDIVAPGNAIYTTDRQGSDGLNIQTGTAGNYTSNIQGTSFATPIVSGIAALVLSANPSLTHSQARQVIESTTTKVSGYGYTLGAGENSALTWNNEVGYGRVNAFKAVEKALGGPITGPGLICSNGTFSMTAVPLGTVFWSTSNSDLLTIDSYGYASRVGSGNGSVTIKATQISDCGYVTLTKTVWVGAPSYVVSIDGINTNSASVSSGSFHSLNAATLSPGSTSYSFTDYTGSGDMSISLSPSGSYAYVYVNGSSTTGHREIMVSGTNSCGSLNQTAYLYLSGMFRIYPNPVKSDMTVEFSNHKVKETLPTEISLLAEHSVVPVVTKSVWDYYDKNLFKDGNKVILDVHQLPRGTYYLHVKYSDTQAKPMERIRLVLE